MINEIKEIKKQIWFGIGAFIIICFVIVGISFKVNTDAEEAQIKQEEEQEIMMFGHELIEMLQGQEIPKQAKVIAYALSRDVYEEDYVRTATNLDKNLMVLLDLPVYNTDKDTVEVASAFAYTLFAGLKMMLELNPNSIETVNIGFIATFIDEQGDEFEKIALGFSAYTNKLMSTDLYNLSYKNLDQICFEIELHPAFDLKY